jgi:MFS family permease
MNLPALQRRIMAVIFIAQSFFSASTIAAFTLSSVIAADLSGSDMTAGVPNTLLLVGRALFAYPLGYMMDRFGRRPALVTGYSFTIWGGLVCVAAIIGRSYALFTFGAFLLGIARSAGDQSRYVAAEVYPITQRAKVIGWVVFAGTIGAIGGPLLVDPSGQLVSRYLGWPADAGPYFISTILMFVGILVVWFALTPDPREVGDLMAEQQGQTKQTNTGRVDFSLFFSSPLTILAMLSMILGYFVMSFLMVITPLHMDHHNHTHQAISQVIMAHTLGMFGLSGLTGWLIDRYGRVPMIAAGGVVLVIACIVAPLSLFVPVLALALFLLGLGWNFTFVAGSSLLADVLPAETRGQMQGTSEAIVSAISGIASLSVGYVFAQGDYLLVSIIGFICSFGLLVAVAVLGGLGRVKKAEAEAEG